MLLLLFGVQKWVTGVLSDDSFRLLAIFELSRRDSSTSVGRKELIDWERNRELIFGALRCCGVELSPGNGIPPVQVAIRSGIFEEKYS